MITDRLVPLCRRVAKKRDHTQLRTTPEPLEARVVPAVNLWIGVGGGDWGVAANWSDGVPTADDDVTIDGADAQTITIVTGTRVANSLSVLGDDSLQMSGGTLTLTAASSATHFILSGGTLNAGPQLTLADTATFSGNASVSGLVRNEGTLTIAGDPNLTGTLDNADTITNSGRIDFSGAGRMNNLIGATYESNVGNITILSGATTGGFFNAGTFHVTSSATATVSALFHNLAGGNIELMSGTLALHSDGTWEGAHFVVSPGAVVSLNVGSKTWTGDYIGTGGGLVRLGGGTQGASAGGDVTPGAAGMRLNFEAGMFEFSGTASINAGGTVTNLGSMTTAGFTNLGTTLDNLGTILVTGRFGMSATARLNNLTGATIEGAIVGGGTIFTGGASGGIFNAGTFRSTEAGTATVSAVFNNLASGTIEATNGTLALHSNGTWEGAHFVVSPGALVTLNAGSKTWTGDFTGTGGGIVRLGGGTQGFSAGGALTIGAAGARLNFGLGMFEFANNSSILAGGTMTNVASMRITEFPNLSTTLVNEGTMIIAGQLDMSGAARLNNLEGATVQAAIAGTLIAGTTTQGIFNAGKFLMAGGGTATVSSTFNNLPTGNFEVVSGTLALHSDGTWEGAHFVVSPGAVFSLNVGSKTWTGDYIGTGGGLVRLGGGTQGASAGGDVTPGAAGMRLNFEAGMFEFSGTASINAGGTVTNLGSMTTAGFTNLGTTLDNLGTILVTGRFGMSATARLNNLTGATIEGAIVGGGTIFTGGASGGIFNAGTFRSTEAGTATVSAVFNNLASGTIEATNGTLALHSAGLWQGAHFNVAAGAVVTLNAGTKIWTGSYAGSGAGIVRLGGGTQGASAGGTIVVGSSGAMLNFTGGGYFEFSGNSTLSGEKVVNRGKFVYSGFPNLGVILENEGEIDSFGRLDYSGSAQVHNQPGGLFKIALAANGSITSGTGSTPGILNEGTIILTTAVTATSSASFANTGIVHASGGGTLNLTGSTPQLSGGVLTGGTWIVDAGATLGLQANVTTNNATVELHGSSTQLNAIRTNNGSLTLGRTFTSTTAFTNNGTLELAPGGLLAVTGALTFGVDSETIFGLAGTAAGSFGRVTATGAAALAGKVSLSLYNDYAPANGDTYQLATFASRTGAFSEGDGFLFQRTRVFNSQLNSANFNVTSLASTSDLTVSGVGTSNPLLPGQPVTVDFTVNNLVATDTFGTTWTDSAYLSLDDIYDPSDLLIGRAVHTGSVPGLGSYNGSIAGTVPLVIDGNYRVIVIADSRGQTPDSDRTNNDGASASLPLVVPALTPGIPLNSTIADGQSLLYRVDLPALETRSFFANLNLAGQAEVLVRQGAAPTSAINDGYAFSTTREDLTILLPGAQAGTYYVEIHGRAAAGAGTAFSFTAASFDFGVLGIDRPTAHNVGNVTLKIAGSHFSPLTDFDLIAPDGAILPALNVVFASNAVAYATFNLSGEDAGAYDVRATQDSISNTLNDALGVVAGGQVGELQFSLSVPSYIRPNGRPGIVTVEYFNAGDSDLYAPLLLLDVEDVMLRFTDRVEEFVPLVLRTVKSARSAAGVDFIGAELALADAPSQDDFKLGGMQFFAVNDEGPAGILPPGARATLRLEFMPVSFEAHDKNDFTLTQVRDFTPIDWDDLSDSLRPVGLSDAGWDIVFGNMKARLGDTFGELSQAASETLNHLSLAGGASPDLDDVLQFETMVADAFGEISERFKTGSYGLGYDGPEGFKVTELVDGRVRVGRVDGFLTFAPNGAGGYLALNEEGATLAAVANEWLLTRPDGAEIRFDRTSGLFESLTYLDGSVVSASYNGSNQLVSFTLPQGDTINFTYNAEGLVSAVDGPDTRHTEFTYVNGRRASVTDGSGTSTYTYVEAPGSNAFGALASVTLPGEAARTFTYDAQGWLASASLPGLEVSFHHPGIGRFGYSLADGTSFTTVLDAQARTVQQYDHTGRSLSLEYDTLGALSAVNGPDSTRYDLAEFRPGKVTATSPDGDTITVVRDTLGRLVSFTDGNGNKTRYEYDSLGRAVSTLYPDGSRESVTYNSEGNFASFTNRRGQTTLYTTDASGVLLSVDYPTAPDESYTYDADSRVTGVTANGQTTGITYDAAGRVTEITFAGGRTLEYAYDTAGRLDRMEDQTGWVVDYIYTPEGPLDQIRDGSGALLLDYTYDALGQVVRKDFANGTATTFTYGLTNRITSIQHLAPGGAVLSSFAYTYDINGRMATMTTLEGVTDYAYTRDGKLASVELPNGRLISYTYDAAGNRTQVDDNGALANYTVNSLNAYTSAGATTFTYDSGGNPITRTDASGTTTYSYDEQGRVTALNGPEGYVQFEYNVFGRIAAVTRDGERREYLYDPNQNGIVLAEYDGSGNLLSHYLPGMGLEAQITAGGEFRAFGFDASGNTALVTGTGGSVLNNYSYLPFGEVLARTEAVANPFEFVGQRGVMEVGNGESLVSLRLYNPEQGRFTSPDPRPQAGANAYAYSRNQPLTLIDFNGFEPSETMSALGEVNSYAAVINTPLDLTLGSYLDDIIEADRAAEALNLAKAAASPTAEGAAAYKTSAALYKNNAQWLEMNSPSKVLGEITTGLDVAVFANTAYNYANGDATGWDLLHDGANVVADFASNVPGFQALKLVPVIDVGSQLVFGSVANAYYDPGDLSINGGERARDILARANLLGLTLDEYLWKFRHGRNEEITPRDPNDIFGPAGFGAEETPEGVEVLTRFEGFITDDHTFDYQIVFENKSDATAPAQNITITHQLDSDLDFATFELGDFGFGAFEILVPEGRTAYNTRVDATATLGIFVDFSASVNAAGLVTWTLNSIDPTTGDLPLDPFAGLLPPNITAPEGDGYVRFRIAPKAGLGTGTDIDAQATIVFDLEAPLNTPLVTSTIDNAAPNGTITAFPAATSSRKVFAVRWSGADEVGGSGIQNFDIYYTDDGGAPTLWKAATTSTAARFAGEVGHTYAFFALGRDNAGNLEALNPGSPDATIDVVAPILTAVGKKFTFTDEDGDLVTVTYAGPGMANLVLLDAGAGRQRLDQVFVDGGDVQKSNLAITVKKKDGPDADKLPDGDGLLNIGDLTVTGALASFKGAAVNLTVDGFSATGPVKTLQVRDVFRADPLLADPSLGGQLTQLKFGGTNVDKTKVTARNLADGISISTPGVISTLSAASIGDGLISAAALSKLTTTLGGMNADLAIAGNAGPITLKLGANAGSWTAANFGTITLGASLEADIASTGDTGAVLLKAGSIQGDIDVLGKITSASVKAGSINGQLTAATIGPVSITGGDLGGFIGSSAAPAKTKGLASLLISGGNLTGSVLVAGNAGPITVKENVKSNVGGNISGPITAHSFGAVTLLGGGLSGVLNATGSALALGKSLAVAKLSVTGGDLLADVRAFGAVGAVSVKADKLGNGGNITDVNLTAAKIAALTVARNVTDSIIMAGGDLGADHEPGGGDDTFLAGTIGAVNIGSKVGTVTFGDVISSVIAAGLSNPDGVFNNGDDTLLGTTPKITSKIASLIIKGANTTGSYFATGAFTQKPKIAGATIAFPHPQFRVV